MSHYDTPVPKIVSDDPKLLKFRRRILSPWTAPRPFVKILRFAAHVAAFAAVVDVVLFFDFGQSDHCFTPVRDWYQIKRKEFLTLSAQDKMGKLKFNLYTRIGCINKSEAFR